FFLLTVAIHCLPLVLLLTSVFFFYPPATSYLYTLSLHDALPILECAACPGAGSCGGMFTANTMSSAIEAMGMSLPGSASHPGKLDRKSTRLNSSHVSISYAVFCLKKKKNRKIEITSHEITDNECE